MKDKEVYFLLYASCIPVSGYKQTVICDINNEVAKILPNDLFHFVAQSKDTDVETLKKIYHNEYNEIIDNLFNHLVSENMGFYTNSPQCFPKMSLLWETPHLLTNIILDIKKDSVLENSVFNQIEESGCETIQIRFLFNVEISDIKKSCNISTKVDCAQ